MKNNDIVIIIKIGEIFLKRKRKKYFMDRLYSNIIWLKKRKIINYDLIKVGFNVLYINFSQINMAKKAFKEIQDNIFGISRIVLALKIENKINKIEEYYRENYKFLTGETYALKIKRINKKTEFNREEIITKVSSIIEKNTKLKVNLTKPDNLLEIEIHNNGTYIFLDNKKGKGGLPTGIGGNALSMLSAGIDSPVSSFLMMKKGVNVDYIHFLSKDFGNKRSIEKVHKNIKILQKYNKKPCTLYTVDVDLLLKEINCINKVELKLIIVKRFFYKIAQHISTIKKYDCLFTGESLNQVSTQTIINLNNIQEVLNKTLIIRPLSNLDKNEIIEIARIINTYEISIEKGDDLCNLYIGDNNSPISKLEDIIEQEKKLLLNELYKITINEKITTTIWK